MNGKEEEKIGSVYRIINRNFILSHVHAEYRICIRIITRSTDGEDFEKFIWNLMQKTFV